MFYKIIDNDKKLVIFSKKKNEKYGIITEGEVERGYDNNYYIKGYAPQKPLEELKQEKIRELKDNCSNYIYSQYPIHKQLNIANGLATEEEISEMTTFIQKARLICEDIEQKINSVKTQKELEKISTNFNQE